MPGLIRLACGAAADHDTAIGYWGASTGIAAFAGWPAAP